MGNKQSQYNKGFNTKNMKNLEQLRRPINLELENHLKNAEKIVSLYKEYRNKIKTANIKEDQIEVLNDYIYNYKNLNNCVLNIQSMLYSSTYYYDDICGQDLKSLKLLKSEINEMCDKKKIKTFNSNPVYVKRYKYMMESLEEINKNVEIIIDLFKKYNNLPINNVINKKSYITNIVVLSKYDKKNYIYIEYHPSINHVNIFNEICNILYENVNINVILLDDIYMKTKKLSI